MYTSTKLGDTVDKQKRRRIVTVQFSNGESTFDKDFTFFIDEDVLSIKKVIKDYLEDINSSSPAISDGEIDFSDIPTPTVDELARTQWNADLAKLKEVQELIDLGVLDGTETPVVNLRNKVKDDFKPAYIA